MKRRLCLGWLLIGLFLPLIGCASALSREQEIAIGQQSAPRFMAEGGGPIPDPAVQQYVTQLGRKLLAHIPPQEQRDLPWEFHTLNSSVVNAFALPGGKVFVSRGLLQLLDSEAALAGVVGHEIGHVVAEHIGEQMARARNLQIGLTVIGAATDNQWVDVLGGTSGKLYLLKFGRGQELEADTLGIEYLVRSRYDPAAMLRLMEVLKKAGGGGGVEFLSTHPHPESRVEQIKHLLSTKYAHTRNNPQYQTYAQEYQSQVLARLKQLPPPKDKAK